MERPKASVVRRPDELLGTSHRFDLQQRHNLMWLLQHSLVEGDYPSVAAICSTLLSSEFARKVASKAVTSAAPDRDRAGLSFVLSAATEALLRSSLSQEKVLQQVQRIMRSQPTYAGLEKSTFDMVAVLFDHGEVQQAFELLSHKPSMRIGLGRSHTPKSVQLFDRAAYCAIIKYHQWLKILSSLRSEKETENARRPASRGDVEGIDWGDDREGEEGREEGDQGPPLESVTVSLSRRVFFYDPELWLRAKSNRTLRGLGREWETLIKEALSHRPDATLLSYLQCNGYIVAGKFRKALAAAQSATRAAPCDTDALCLHVMVQEVCTDHIKVTGEEHEPQTQVNDEIDDDGLVAGGSPPQQQESMDNDETIDHQSGQLLLQMMQSDPSNTAAFQRLLGFAPHCMYCQERAVCGSLLFLDASSVACMDTPHLRALVCSAWEALSQGLRSLASMFLGCGVDSPLAEVGTESDSEGSDSDSNSDSSEEGGRKRGRSREKAGVRNHVRSEDKERDAGAVWKQVMEEELADRACWWPQALLNPPQAHLYPPSTILSHLTTARQPHRQLMRPSTSHSQQHQAAQPTPGATPAAHLTCKAVVACFMLGSSSSVVLQTTAFLKSSLGQQVEQPGGALLGDEQEAGPSNAEAPISPSHNFLAHCLEQVRTAQERAWEAHVKLYRLKHEAGPAPRGPGQEPGQGPGRVRSQGSGQEGLQHIFDMVEVCRERQALEHEFQAQALGGGDPGASPSSANGPDAGLHSPNQRASGARAQHAASRQDAPHLSDAWWRVFPMGRRVRRRLE